MVAPYLQGRNKGGESQLAGSVLLASILLLPTLFPEKIGWLTSLVPLPVCYYLVTSGKENGPILIRNGILLAAVGALIFGSLPMLLFALTMVPLGIIFSHGIMAGRTPVATGFNGTLTLAFTWFIYWSGLALLYQINPYDALLTEIDNGLRGGLMLYEETAELAPETLQRVQRGVELLRVYIPKILPALLVSVLLTTVWLNLVIGDWLLKKRFRQMTCWPEFKEWKLPEPLVWFVVLFGAVFLIMPRPLSTLGLNGLIICSTLYFFQGLAIAASLLHKWSVPRLIRVLIYTLIFIQSYGIIVLSFLGLIDVWADFRKLDQAPDNSDSSL